MPQSKILVDTNVYLRLAQSIHPLLKTPFGKQNYCLYNLPEMADEYHKNPRLQSSFPWFPNDEYSDNRNCHWSLKKKQHTEIEDAYDFILDSSYDLAPNISRVDLKCLAYALVLNIPVATDDAEMIKLADEFEINTITMVQLLKLMLDNGHITLENIRTIAGYLMQINDLPKNFKGDYKLTFFEELPDHD